MLQMSKKSLSDLVLDSIDIISARKNRPNLVRIFQQLHRSYDLSIETCESLIQSLLKEGRVIRVTYKGNISYRNALKWKKYSYYMKKKMGSELSGTILTKALSELIVQEPDYLSMGVPFKILEDHLLSMQIDNITKENINNLLQRELNQESLIVKDNGNYFLGPKPQEKSFLNCEEVSVKTDQVKLLRTYKQSKKKSKDKNNGSLNLDEGTFADFSEFSNDISNSEVLGIDDSELTLKTYDVDYDSLVIKDDYYDQEILQIKDDSSNLECSKSNTDSHDEIMTTSPNDFSLDTIHKGHAKNIVAYDSIRNGNIIKTLDLKCIKMTGKEKLKNLESNEKIDKVCTMANIDDNSNSALTGSPILEPFYTSLEDESNCIDLVEPVNSVYKELIEKPLLNVTVEEERLSLECFSTSKRISPTDLINSEQNENCEITKSSQSGVSNYNDLSNCEGSLMDESSTSLNKSTDKVNKTVGPVVERVQRKKRTKYDASDYFFPSLKRKTRESLPDNNKKADKVKKKRKKDNGARCISGMFAKRVISPGNANLCCECNNYISKVKLDPIIFCETCPNQGHQICASKTMDGDSWYCIGCRSENASPVCTVCSQLIYSQDKSISFCCFECGDSYHKKCHSASITVSSPNESYCQKCSKDISSDTQSPHQDVNMETENITTTHGSNSLTSISKSDYFDDEPPETNNWSSSEVYNYFKENIDEESARPFMDQDIDGYALKLMERSDVLNLGLKLGPGLKVLLHVRRLQLRTNILTEIWKS